MRRVFEEGAAPLAERLRVHNRMRIRPVGLRRDLLRVEPWACWRANYARALYEDPGATLDNVREAVTTLDETARIARRVLGGSHPVTQVIDKCLRNAALRVRAGIQVEGVVRASRAALRARETPPPEGNA